MSPDVDMDRTNPLQPAMGQPPMYVCNKCNHCGYVFPEVSVSKINKFEREAKREGSLYSSPDKTPKVDTRYGDFEVKFLWKIMAPIMFIFGLVLLFIELIYGTIVASVGLLMVYITYSKKRKLSGN